ncbi:hypothetical protein ES703_33130 [subsurface metagenome]
MNIFRQAKQLLDKEDAGGKLTKKERQLIATAEIPFLIRKCPYLKDMPTRDCLETLAQIVEGVD